ncbi:MAG: bifunctional demethylmenaquinone methyltransferase/2-methoxy-6-polyprenyl-1,4-benzoquinol methylase UbiE [Sphingobacteriaceae bacterium]|nr:bifunctional demethylmenaquinone methyltransferase/2-methoxy-6-polyprenyl-1,4-benzoquinol methylase UbiE [Sphingobacteriaceae bacterium]
MQHDSITPYKNSEAKKDQVANMFDNISHRYDFLNNLLSFGIQKGWRKKCVKLLLNHKPQIILDVATGTADFALECIVLKPQQIIGIDISEGMMKIGREKIKKKGFENIIKLEQASAENFNYPNNSFDTIVIGYGVRNFENLEMGLNNLLRVLKPGGKMVILEFSYPKNPFIKAIYTFYFSYITPIIGRIFSKDPRAYSYLTESVKAFPNNENFTAILEKCGFINSNFKSLSFGVAAIYTSEKRK